MTSTRTRTRLRGDVRARLIVVSVAAIVLGILGMHGFGGHDTDHGAAMSSATTGSDSPAGQPPTAVTDPDGGHPAGMGSMAMTCGVMLAAAAITGLLLLLRRSGPPRLWAVLALADDVWRPQQGARLLSTSPPVAWRFSVIRC